MVLFNELIAMHLFTEGSPLSHTYQGRDAALAAAGPMAALISQTTP